MLTLCLQGFTQTVLLLADTELHFSHVSLLSSSPLRLWLVHPEDLGPYRNPFVFPSFGNYAWYLPVRWGACLKGDRYLSFKMASWFLYKEWVFCVYICSIRGEPHGHSHVGPLIRDDVTWMDFQVLIQPCIPRKNFNQQDFESCFLLFNLWFPNC